MFHTYSHSADLVFLIKQSALQPSSPSAPFNLCERHSDFPNVFTSFAPFNLNSCLPSKRLYLYPQNGNLKLRIYSIAPTGQFVQFTSGNRHVSFGYIWRFRLWRYFFRNSSQFDYVTWRYNLNYCWVVWCSGKWKEKTWRS